MHVVINKVRATKFLFAVAGDKAQKRRLAGAAGIGKLMFETGTLVLPSAKVGQAAKVFLKNRASTTTKKVTDEFKRIPQNLNQKLALDFLKVAQVVKYSARKK